MTPSAASLSALVAVVAVGDGVDTTPIVDRLRRVGVTTTTDEGAATLLVVVTDDHLQPALAEINADCVGDGPVVAPRAARRPPVVVGSTLPAG